MTNYSDATIIFTSNTGFIGRWAKRVVSIGQLKYDRYTHVAILFDDIVYESAPPAAHTTPVDEYGKHGGETTLDFYQPKEEFSALEIETMLSKAEEELGKPYQLKNYFWKNSRKTIGTWCSKYVSKVLNAGGYGIPENVAEEPDSLWAYLQASYVLKNTVKK